MVSFVRLTSFELDLANVIVIGLKKKNNNKIKTKEKAKKKKGQVPILWGICAGAACSAKVS